MNESLLAKLILLQMRQSQQLSAAIVAQMDTSWSNSWEKAASRLENAENHLEQAEKLVSNAKSSNPE